MPPNGPSYVTATIFLVLVYQLGENQWACIPRPSIITPYSTVCMVGESVTELSLPSRLQISELDSAILN